MQLKRAPRVTANPFAGLGSKVFFCFLLLSALVIGASAETSSGTNNGNRITILPNQLAIAYTSVPYSDNISVHGGSAPYQFSFIRGIIPPGLYLDTNTGTVTGTPTTAGSFNFRVVITDLPKSDRGEVTVYVIVRGASTGITVSVSPGNASVPSAGTQQFSATVRNTANTAVTWTASTGTISSSGLFTAPSVSAVTTASVTATSVADPTKHSQATITVNPPAVVSVSVSPTSSSLISAGSQQFTATVANTSNTAVTWSVSSGTISSSGLFTAPSVSSSTTATVTATSVADTTKSAQSSVTINPSGTVGVTVSPTSTSVISAGTRQFTATVSNTSNTGVTWSSSSGTISSGGVFAAPSVSSSTTATITARSMADTTKSAQATVFVSPTTAPPPPPTGGNYDGPAELPRVYLQTTMADTPAPGTTTLVGAGQNLQTAINNANCGDTLLLQAGATFSVGVITLPNKPCDDSHYIVIRSSAADSNLPPEGTRLLPCYSGVASLPGRPAFSCPGGVQTVTAQILFAPGAGIGPFQWSSGANHYRLGPGLEITRSSGTGGNYQFVGPANGNSSIAADAIFLDRVWLHGTAQDDSCDGLQTNGLLRGGIFDSYVNDFHSPGSGTCSDPKAVAGGLGSLTSGPHRIHNNFLEASGENILYGGGGATVTPADIEITGNHFYKPLIWKSGQPGFVGGTNGAPFSVKNLLELKNAQRVDIKGNIFEYSWGGFSQAGWAFLVTPKNQAAGTSNLCPTCETTDVTFRFNTISHAGGGISLANVNNGNGAAALAGTRYSIHDVTIDDISASAYVGSGYLLQVLSGWTNNPLNSIVINHITGFPDPKWGFIQMGNAVGNPAMYGFTFTNNIIGQHLYPIWSTGGTTNCAVADVPLAVLTTCFPAGYQFTQNAFIAVNANNFPASEWPASNLFASSAGAAGFVNFNGGNGGNYQLVSSSPYKNAATDGTDLGADINAIQSLTANVY